MSTDPLFTKAMDALFGVGSHPLLPVCTEYHQTKLVDIRSYADKSHELPDYWIPCQHKEALPQNLENYALFDQKNGGPLNVKMNSLIPYRLSNVVVIETDSLLLPAKDEPEPWAWNTQPDNELAEAITKDWCRVQQPLATHAAAVLSNMPFTVAVHSGSKSCHFYIVFSDDCELTPRPQGRYQRDSERARRFDLLMEVLGLVLGNFDSGVFKKSGFERKVRVPGGTRADGNSQQILSVPGHKPSFDQFLEWGLQQLHPDVQKELRAPDYRPRPYGKGEFKRRRLRLDTLGWRNALYQIREQGDHRLGEQWHICNKELIKGGLAEPEILERPCIENGSWGRYKAPFLWLVQAYVLNELYKPVFAQHPQAPAPYGYVFSGNPWWWEDDGGQTQGDASRMRTWWCHYEEFSHELDQRLGGRPAAGVPGTPSYQPPVMGWEERHDPIVEAWAEQADISVLQKKSPLPPDFPVTREQVKDLVVTARSTPMMQNPVDPGQVMEYSNEGDNDGTGFVERQEHFLSYFGHNIIYATENAKPWANKWLSYNGRYWDLTSDKRVLTVVNSAYETYPLYTMTKAGPVQKEIKSSDRNELKDAILASTKRSILFENEWEPSSSATVFKNGTLYTENNTCRFEQDLFDPKDRVLGCLPYDYDPEMATPVFDRYLETSFPDEQERKIALQFLGYCFYPRLPFKFFLMVVGGKDSGKSTFLNIASALVGERDAVASLSFHNMMTDSYWAAQLPKAKVMLISEEANTSLSNKKAITDILKRLTGNDSVTVRMMQQNPFNMRVYSKLIMAVNTLPDMVDNSSAFWERILLVRPQRPSVLIKDLEDQVRAELPGVAARAVEALQELFMQGGFKQTSDMIEAVDDFRQSNDPLLTFWNDWMEEAPGAYCYSKAVMFAFNQSSDGRWKNPRKFVQAAKAMVPGLTAYDFKGHEDKLGDYNIKHLPENHEKRPLCFHGWVCKHKVIEHFVPPVVDMKDRGTSKDPTLAPPPRRSNVIPMPGRTL